MRFVKKIKKHVKRNQNKIQSRSEDLGKIVEVPCIECIKHITKFVDRCSSQQIDKQQIGTFRQYCDEQISEIKDDGWCQKLSTFLTNSDKKQFKGKDLIYEEYQDNQCFVFRSKCEKLGGPPTCYESFCQKIASCFDCPYGVIDTNGNGNFELQVCSGNGVCKIGWVDTKTAMGNGYCECNQGTRGLACNQLA